MTATAAIVHHDNPYPTANPGRPRPVVLVAEESDVERRYLTDNLAADGYTIRIAVSVAVSRQVVGEVAALDIAFLTATSTTGRGRPGFAVGYGLSWWTIAAVAVMMVPPLW